MLPVYDIRGVGVSPGCSDSFDQSIVSPSSRGGVPVFSLPTLKGMALSFCARILLGGSPILPPGFCSSPVCIIPPRKVPVVKTTFFAFTSPVLEVLTAFIISFSTTISSTESSNMVRFFSAFKSPCIASLYNCLSVCALVALTAWPFVAFNTL